MRQSAPLRCSDIQAKCQNTWSVQVVQVSKRIDLTHRTAAFIFAERRVHTLSDDIALMTYHERWGDISRISLEDVEDLGERGSRVDRLRDPFDFVFGLRHDSAQQSHDSAQQKHIAYNVPVKLRTRSKRTFNESPLFDIRSSQRHDTTNTYHEPNRRAVST